ncbi:hypothetical protein, partial [uncultured Gimesia sp.]|uniref:hypothetical protein n=1 Tax=uncultured Gimesia sp. TaxID=1678688 RepID=UPI00260BBF3B
FKSGKIDNVSITLFGTHDYISDISEVDSSLFQIRSRFSRLSDIFLADFQLEKDNLSTFQFHHTTSVDT